jgi:head-tail adaptor
MMRAGKMDRQFTIDRASETIDDAGTPVQSWAPIAAMWGELVENSTADSPQAEGSRPRRASHSKPATSRASRSKIGSRIRARNTGSLIFRRSGAVKAC